jgi:hypothetical protein
MSIEEFDVGMTVLCDMCNKDFTDSEAVGGFLFQSKGICPECAPRIRDSLVHYGETEYIQAECPKGMSFREFCLLARAGDNKIRIYSGEDIPWEK